MRSLYGRVKNLVWPFATVFMILTGAVPLLQAQQPYQRDMYWPIPGIGWGGLGDFLGDFLSRPLIGEPVDAVTGHFHHDVHDLLFPAPGLPVHLARHYSSGDVSAGDFGRGWSWTYGIKILPVVNRPMACSSMTACFGPCGGGGSPQAWSLILEPGRGEGVQFQRRCLGGCGGGSGSCPSFERDPIVGVAVKFPDGRRLYFHKTGGQYYPPNGLFRTTLEEQAEGNVFLLTSDNIQYRFAGEKLTEIRDLNNNTITFQYNARGRIGTITDSVGRTYRVDWRGRTIWKITDPANRVVEYGYDGQDLVSVKDREGNETRYEYRRGQMTKIRNRRQQVLMELEYEKGRVKKQHLYREGRRHTYEFIYQPGKTTLRNTRGFETTYHFDVRSRITRIDYPQGPPTYYEWNDDGTLKQKTDRLGRVTEYQYDGRKNLTRIRENRWGEGPTFETEFQYHPTLDLLTEKTLPNGYKTTYTYSTDGRGHLLAVRRNGQRVAEYADYNERGQPRTVRDAFGDAVQQEYDPVTGGLQTITDAQGNQTVYEYDPAGWLARVIERTPAGPERTTAFRYDKMNRLTHITDPAGGVTRYGYDADGHRRWARDAERARDDQPRYDFTYDEQGHLTSVTNPLGQTRRFEYDGEGHRRYWTNARGQVIETRYDPLDRPEMKRLPEGIEVDYTYDDENHLRTVRTRRRGVPTPLTALSFTYDALARVKTRTFQRAGQAWTITYHYDERLATEPQNKGRLTSLQDPQNTLWHYGYDRLDRLTAIRDGQGTELIELGYDARDRRTRIARLNHQLLTSVAFDPDLDPLRRLTSITHRYGEQTRMQFDYTYDGFGRIETITEPAGEHRYGYDTRDWLETATHPQLWNPPEAYTYDRVGNRQTAHRQPATACLDAANRLRYEGQFLYTYDADGNLTSKCQPTAPPDCPLTTTPTCQTGTETRYTFDAENQLTQIVLSDGRRVSYTYDGLGHRIEKQVGEAIQRFLYDGPDLLQIVQADGTVQSKYLHGPGVDDPLAVDIGPNRYFYLTDHLGSVRALVDSQGTVVAQTVYDAFGNIMEESGRLPQPFRYTGREWEAESGLYYYRARYYDPHLGRFLSEDPRGFDEGPNFYAYVHNNPISLRDPSGEQALGGGLAGVGTGMAIALMTGGKYTVGDALRDFAVGAAFGFFARAMRGLTAEALAGVCFLEGTKVLTPNGEVPIEELVVGDFVFSGDPVNEQTVSRQISKIFLRTVPTILDIQIGATTISCTPEHPFWIPGRGWTRAEQLEPGTRVLAKDGKVHRVDSVQARKGSFPVYNLEVSDLHTYYVSELGILVHNSCMMRPKPVNLPAWRKVAIDMEHIASGHMEGGVRAMQSGVKDLFPPSMSARQIERAVREAYRYSSKLYTQGERVLVEGVTSDGLRIQMWINLVTREIKTAYPIY